MKILHYLNHTNLRKEGDTYFMDMRTDIGAEFVKDLCRKKGVKVVVNVSKPRMYFKSQEERLAYWEQQYPMFKEFKEVLGLKITEK